MSSLWNTTIPRNRCTLFVLPSLSEVWRLLQVDVCPLSDTPLKLSFRLRCLAASLPYHISPCRVTMPTGLGRGPGKTVGSGSCQQQLRLTTCKCMQMKRSSHDTCTQEEWTVPFPTEDSGCWIPNTRAPQSFRTHHSFPLLSLIYFLSEKRSPR